MLVGNCAPHLLNMLGGLLLLSPDATLTVPQSADTLGAGHDEEATMRIASSDSRPWVLGLDARGTR